MRRLYPLLCLAAIILALAPCGAQPMVEFRGLYVDAFHPGLTNHEEVTQMVKAAKDANFNALFVQVRKRGDAYYKSSIEPRASCLAADYDPLADVITQAHAAGLEVHAWLTVYEAAHESHTLSDSHVCRAHPEWLMPPDDGATTHSGGRIFLDPCAPGVQDYLVSVVADIAAQYDADGIHLDGCRYLGRGGACSKIALDLFAKETGRTDAPKYDDKQWCDWRRAQVTGLVRKIHDKLAAVRPSARLSALAVTPTPAKAAEYAFQDWDGWMRDGIVDFVVPAVYSTSSSIAEDLGKVLPAKHDRHMYIGLGAYQVATEVAQRQIDEARAAGADGVVLYSYDSLVAQPSANAQIRDLKTSVFAESAARPAMSWRQAAPTKGEAR